MHRLSFNGFEAIDPKSADKLFLQSPEVLLRTTKEDIYKSHDEDILVEVHSATVAFVPLGHKAGWLKPILFDTKALTRRSLIAKVLEYQNLDFIQTKEIVVDRIGLHYGVPSYCIRTE